MDKLTEQLDEVWRDLMSAEDLGQVRDAALELTKAVQRIAAIMSAERSAKSAEVKK